MRLGTEIAKQSGEFRRAAQAVVEAAKKKNLDGPPSHT
jgi:hypothetical protein